MSITIRETISDTRKEQSIPKEKPTPWVTSFREGAYWFFRSVDGQIFGPFDKVYESLLGERKVEERELNRLEMLDLLLQFN